MLSPFSHRPHRRSPLHKFLYKISFVLIFTAILPFYLSNCYSDESTQLYEPEEATVLIATAFATKDYQCGASHNITLPIVAEADEDDVDLCVSAILASTCAAWAASDPTPSLCLLILVKL